MRYLVKLSYKGTRFHGWQIQPNAVTVQETLEQAFSLLLRQNIKITGAGRTDTGVHALVFYAHFDLEDPKEINCAKLTFRLNSYLSEDIVIHKIQPVSSDFHSRFSAISRTYEYRIHLKKNPFLHGLSYFFYSDPDFEKMNQASSLLLDYKDFTSFSKLHTDTTNNLCKIFRAQWKAREEEYVFTIEANRFLRNMVRAITGTLFDVGKGKISPDDFASIIEAKNRSCAGVSAPACGLFLTEVKYPESLL